MATRFLSSNSLAVYFRIWASPIAAHTSGILTFNPWNTMSYFQLLPPPWDFVNASLVCPFKVHNLIIAYSSSLLNGYGKLIQIAPPSDVVIFLTA